MPLAKSTTYKKINWLGAFRVSLAVLLTAYALPVFSQDNSPYSRYGLGDIVPSTNVNTRSMGGIAAGYSDFLSINYANPASYAGFQALREANSKKMAYGRAILDAAINIENRTLREPNTTDKFTASNLLFSHVQIGVPLRPNWGLSFGLRPVTRISYKMLNGERLVDPNTGQPIDSSQTLSQGDGGAYLPNIGTGFRFRTSKTTYLSLGFSIGYLFGEKDYSTRRTFINDTVSYNPGNFQTTTNYNNLFYSGGLQYSIQLKDDKKAFSNLTIGAYGNLKRNLNASQDIIRETFFYDETVGYVRLDSVAVERNVKGKIVYPSTYTVGFVYQHASKDRSGASWLFGVDYSQSKWSEYRFYGQVDPTVKDKWELRVGGQLRPVSKRNYFSNVDYRIGFFTGPDYISVNNEKLNLLGITGGFGLPLLGSHQASQNQATIINLGFEYIKRGNNDNLLKENMFRVSVGLSLSDLWFIRKKYN